MFSQCCPQCGEFIADADVNASTGIAYCRRCNLTHDLQSLKRSPVSMPEANLTEPPPGAWNQDDGMEKVIGATCRSMPKAFGTALIALFWNVPVLMFASVNVVGTLGVIGIHLPDWIPAQVREAGTKMHPGMVCFLWLFMTPFVLIGAAMIDAFFSYLYGRVDVSIADGIGSVTTPLLGFKKRRVFNPAQVKRVWIQTTRSRSRSGTRYSYNIMMEFTEGKPIKFGSYLRGDRRDFVAAALNAALLPRAK